MRPHQIDPLFASASALPGIGPKLAKLFDRLLDRASTGARVVDVLFHLPTSTIDRRSRPLIADAPVDAVVTLGVTITEHRPPPARTAQPYKVLVEDPSGDCLLVFFRNNQSWIEKALPLGAKRYVSGKLELWDGYRQMVHPDRVLDEAGLAQMPAVEPVYGLTEGLFPRIAAKAALGALGRLPLHLPEWIDPALIIARHFPPFFAAFKSLHQPETPDAVDLTTPARQRLAYDEFLAQQLALLLVRASMKRVSGRTSTGDGRIEAKILAALPFKPTNAQTQALAEIHADIASDKRMLRLLQGDVGSGKTLVALLAMAHVVEAGRQAALMAPTEILARQHFERLRPLAEAAGLRLALFTGRDKAAERTANLQKLVNGDIDIAIGTHALFQEAIRFRDLALAVVDEQHRFGVQQRLALGEKGADADVLVMTATPIPRTLVLTNFGDMDVSTLYEKPVGRSPIKTVAMPLERMEEVIAGLPRALAEGARVYWVCPLVDESEELDISAASARAETLAQFFGTAVGLVHGKMPGRDKDAAMQRFQRGETQILVATTVIEVGVDVPEASIMVIEHAERFGLAQLHQLRGRVGRGMAKSSCVLLYKGPLGEVARARIEMLRTSEDGFAIADEDLRLRGEGEILGTRQSGMPSFRLANLDAHRDLLPIARKDAQLLLARDPDLASPRGQAARLLLYLFEKNEAVRLLRAG